MSKQVKPCFVQTVYFNDTNCDVLEVIVVVMMMST